MIISWNDRYFSETFLEEILVYVEIFASDISVLSAFPNNILFLLRYEVLCCQ